jgi:hypothetical protein
VSEQAIAAFANPHFLYGNVETDLGHLLTGRMAALLSEADDFVPTRIIDANLPWRVIVYWQLTGALRSMICGKWCVRLFLESLGKDALDREFSSPLIDLNPCGDGFYYADFLINGNEIKVEECGTPFKPVVTLTYLTSCRMRNDYEETDHRAYRPGPIAGLVSFPITQFFYEGVAIPPGPIDS